MSRPCHRHVSACRPPPGVHIMAVAHAGERGSVVEYGILGPLAVRLPDGVVTPASWAQRLALSVLLVEAGRVVPADRLIEELWGDGPPDDPAAALRNQLSRLRRVLGPAAADLVAAAGGYRLRLERRQLDAARFEDLLASSRRTNGDDALAMLDEALALWRGPALGEFADRPFAQPEAVRLEELRLTAVEQRAELLLCLGQTGDTVVSLGALLAEHPHREGARASFMEALYRQGRHTEALAVYQSWRRHLAEELGLEPSPTLQRLERDILRHALAPDDEPQRPAGRRPSAQSGTHTFLFTDIEASTKRWKEHTETMAADLARHDALLRQAIEAHGGHVFKHTGDGCCAVFPAASAALSAGVAGQLAVSAEQWGPGGPLRVRMALHTGPAEIRGGDYFGPTLNRAARLLALAHGGQTLLSLATTELALDVLPAAVGLRDLGEHRLADLDRPERVFQVDHPELPAHFPPLRSLDTHRHNLPGVLSPFVGRRAELETVRQYAAERLGEAGEVEATRRRHRDFFLALADSALADLSFFWDARRWLPRVRVDHDNFWAALEWSRAVGEPESCLRLAGALSYYWFLEGIFEGRAWLEWGLEEAAGRPPTPVRVRGLVCLAFVILPRGEGDRAVALLEEARALAEAIGDVTGGGMACEVFGVLKYWRGEFDAAEELLEEARRRFDAEDCVGGAWACRFDLGWLALAKGDHPRARVELERSVELSRLSGSEDLIAHSLGALAPVVALAGDAKQAETLADEAIEVARGLGLRLFVVMALVRAGEVAVVLGRMDRAEEVLLESLSLLRDVGGHAWVADALELAALVQAEADPRQAARHLGTCWALAGASDGSPSVRAVRDQIERCRAEVSQALGPDTFAGEWARGREMSVDQAVPDALAQLTSRASTAPPAVLDADRHVGEGH